MNEDNVSLTLRGLPVSTDPSPSLLFRITDLCRVLVPSAVAPHPAPHLLVNQLKPESNLHNSNVRDKTKSEQTMSLELNLDEAILPHPVWGGRAVLPRTAGPPQHSLPLASSSRTLREADGKAEEREHGARGPGSQGGQGGDRGWRADGSRGRVVSRCLSPAPALWV